MSETVIEREREATGVINYSIENTVIRAGLVALHWGWLLVIVNPANPLKHYASYATFLTIMSAHKWIDCSLAIAVLSTIGWSPRRIWLHTATLFLQAGWLFMVSWCSARIVPPTTGAVAYLIFGSFAFYVAIVALHHAVLIWTERKYGRI